MIRDGCIRLNRWFLLSIGVIAFSFVLGLGGRTPTLVWAATPTDVEEDEQPIEGPHADLFATVWLSIAQEYVGDAEVAWDAIGETYHQRIAFASSEADAYEQAALMVAELGDPGTLIRTPDEVRELQAGASGGDIIGVGMLLGATSSGETVVLSVLNGGPADQIGIRRGDRIVAVSGDPVTERSVTDVAGLIRGEEGSLVTIALRDPVGADRSVTVTRAPVEFTPQAESRVLPGNIGYISLTSLREGMDAEFLNLLRRLYRTRGLVIDLRNADGAVHPAVVMRIAGLFTPEPLAALLSRRGGLVLTPIRQWDDDALRPGVLGPTELDYHTKPLAILADNAATASLYTLGMLHGLQESGRATIVGRPPDDQMLTGRGYSVIELPGGGLLNLSTSLLVSLKSRAVVEALTPDQVVPMDVKLLKSWYDGIDLDIEAGRKAVLNALQ